MPNLPLALLIAAFGVQAAAAAPRCTPTRAGEVACLAGKLCECRHESGGALTGRPAAVRWDCGALRPSCGAPLDADVPERTVPPPPVFLPAPPFPPTGWR